MKTRKLNINLGGFLFSVEKSIEMTRDELEAEAKRVYPKEFTSGLTKEEYLKFFLKKYSNLFLKEWLD